MFKKIAVLLATLLMATSLYAADWSNPNPRSGGDTAGQLLLKHELNFTDIYQATTGKLNLLKGNSAGTSAPSSPSTGQTWYDTSNILFKVYGGSTWDTFIFDEWKATSYVPTYISANSFSVPTDVTGTLSVGRRLKLTTSGGTVYATITASVYTSLTTLTVTLDSGSLTGVSAVSMGILNAVNGSAPALPTYTKTADYTILNTDNGKTLVANKATAIAFTLPITSVSKVFTVTSASPAVFTSTTHGFSINDQLRFTTTGSLYTGLAINTAYYIISAGFSADTFQVALTRGGIAVNTSGSQSGVHTAVKETASVPDGTSYLLKNINAGTLTAVGTVDDIVSPTLLQNDQMLVFASNGLFMGKRISATPSVNTVVVGDATGKIGAGWWPVTPCFSAYKSGTQGLTLSADTKLTFTVESFDTNNNFASSTFTPTVAGKYQLNSAVYVDAPSGVTNIVLKIIKNGALYRSNEWVIFGTGAANAGCSVSDVVDANGSTDYFEIFVYIIGSGTINTTFTNNGTYFSGCRIGL
jgi:hypothetical protein